MPLSTSDEVQAALTVRVHCQLLIELLDVDTKVKQIVEARVRTALDAALGIDTSFGRPSVQQDGPLAVLLKSTVSEVLASEQEHLTEVARQAVKSLRMPSEQEIQNKYSWSLQRELTEKIQKEVNKMMASLTVWP